VLAADVAKRAKTTAKKKAKSSAAAKKAGVEE
jgi:hypothetical protein